MVFCYECDTLYDNLADLDGRGRDGVNHTDNGKPIFHCPECRNPFEYWFMRHGHHKAALEQWIAAGFGHLLKNGAQ